MGEQEGRTVAACLSEEVGCCTMLEEVGGGRGELELVGRVGSLPLLVEGEGMLGMREVGILQVLKVLLDLLMAKAGCVAGHLRPRCSSAAWLGTGHMPSEDSLSTTSLPPLDLW